MKEKIEAVKKEYLTKINAAKSLSELDEIFLELFGKNGQITLLPKDFSKESKESLKEIGPLFNQLKNELEILVEEKRIEVREEGYKTLTAEKMDLSKRVKIKKRKGYLHPITKFEKEITNTFKELGFQQFDAPEIDTDFNNFEVLNIPEDHPARDLWDTFYIDKQSGAEKLLLRTHTSNSQIRIMKGNALPIRMMNLGRCFRYENVDARHEHTFEQFEIVYIDQGVSMANLQYLSEYFLKKIYGEGVKARMRPKYYPFVEPGAGVDGQCVFCKGSGKVDGKDCKTCSGVGWLELAGAGMIHPTVLKNGGIDPKKYSGIAWGVGPERMIMLKYDLSDIRMLRSGDLNFLQSFEDK